MRKDSRPILYSQSIVTYLDHDHSERENVRFLAIWPFFQYLWRSPSCSKTTLILDTSHGIQIQSDSSETKVRDPRITGVVHEDVRLGTCQYGRETAVRTITYPFEVPMNHIAGVEVAEALSDVR